MFTRLIAAKAQTQHDAQFVVANRTGGNSTIGGLDVQRAVPDGYTVLFHASTHNVARMVTRYAPYDPMTDFTPIALTGSAPRVHIIAKHRPETDHDGHVESGVLVERELGEMAGAHRCAVANDNWSGFSQKKKRRNSLGQMRFLVGAPNLQRLLRALGKSAVFFMKIFQI